MAFHKRKSFYPLAGSFNGIISLGSCLMDMLALKSNETIFF